MMMMTLNIKSEFHPPIRDLSQCVHCLSALGTLKCLRLLTGNLCDPILNCNDAFLKCSGRNSVYFSFPCDYLKVLYFIITINSITCNSAVPELFKRVTFTFIYIVAINNSLKSCVAQI